MGWSIGFDTRTNRDIGYGVPAYCDHPGCMTKIDRGLSYVCGGEPYGGEEGCGLFFCAKHRRFVSDDNKPLCTRCGQSPEKTPYEPTPDHPQWIKHKLIDASWSAWRAAEPVAFAAMVIGYIARLEAFAVPQPIDTCPDQGEFDAWWINDDGTIERRVMGCQRTERGCGVILIHGHPTVTTRFIPQPTHWTPAPVRVDLPTEDD
jgi:hypothetical protein